MTKLRRGISLAELLVVMSACTLVLTLSTALIHRIMRIQTNAWSFEQGERSALRLSAFFRRDVHEAQEVILPREAENGAFLQLQGHNERRVEYRLADSTIVRVHFAGETVVSRETFHFGVVPVQAIVKEETSLRAITLSLSERSMLAEAGEGAPRSRVYQRPIACHVTAIIGRLALYPVLDKVEAE